MRKRVVFHAKHWDPWASDSFLIVNIKHPLYEQSGRIKGIKEDQ